MFSSATGCPIDVSSPDHRRERVGLTTQALRASDAPLPANPAIQTRTLDNGLSCWFLKHAHPRGAISLCLQIQFGSLYETQQQSGLAHVLEHMAFADSHHFPDGELPDFMESVGHSFESQHSAMTGQDQTRYMLTMSQNTLESVDKAILGLSDIAFRLRFKQRHIDRERAIILHEIRESHTPVNRLAQAKFAFLFPDSLAVKRPPLGRRSVVESMTSRDLRALYEAFYRPDRAHLIIVGDVDRDALESSIRRHFHDWRPPPLPPRSVDAGLGDGTGPKAALQPSPTGALADVEIFHHSRYPDSTRISGFRDNLIEDLGFLILQRRLRSRMSEPDAPGLKYWAKRNSLLGQCNLTTLGARVTPERILDCAASLCGELQSACEAGIQDSELTQIKGLVSSAAQRQVDLATSRSAQSLLKDLADASRDGRPPPSPVQRSDLLDLLLPNIDTKEMSGRLAATFAPESRRLLVTFPKAHLATAPDAATLLEQLQRIRPTARAPETTKITTLRFATPSPGGIQRRFEHSSGVYGVEFDNGVRFHARPMHDSPNRCTLKVVMQGGKIEETAFNRGITAAASQALSRPATSRFDAARIQGFVLDNDLRMDVFCGQDSLDVRLSTSSSSIDSAMSLLHTLLNDPIVQPSCMAAWRAIASSHLDMSKSDLASSLATRLWAFLSNGDRRFVPPDERQIESLDPERVQGWLRRLTLMSPVEAALVGDIPLARAIDLGSAYLGSLPTRAHRLRGSRDLGPIPPRSKPLSVQAVLPTIDARAAVLLAWRSPPWRNVRARRHLSIAAPLLQSFLRTELRENLGLTYQVACRAYASKAYPAVSSLSTRFYTDPDRVLENLEIAARRIAYWASRGPSQAEFDRAKARFLRQLEAMEERPVYWADMLAESAYRGRTPDLLPSLAKDVAADRLTDLMETIHEVIVDGNGFQLALTPANVPNLH